MTASHVIPRYGSTIAICGAGALPAWLSGEPSVLLAAVAASCVRGDRWAGPLSIALCGGAFYLLLFLPGPDLPSELTVPLRLAVFVAAALAIALTIRGWRRWHASDRAEREAIAIVESMPGFGWSTDPQGRFVYRNRSILDYTGKRPGELDRVGSKLGWEQVVHPDDVDQTARLWSECLRSGAEYQTEHRVRRHDGTYRWFRAVARPSRDPGGRTTGWYGTTIDIDDQKKAEEALRASERQLRLLIDTMPAMAWCTNAAGEPTYFSKRMLEYVGRTSEELVLSPFDATHPDDVPAFERAWALSVESGRPFALTYRLRRSDGVYRWHEGRAEPSRDHDGAAIGWYGVNVDIDERKRAEEALRASERQFRLLVDTVPACIWCTTPEGEPSYINKRLADYAGLTLDDLEAPDGTRLTGAIQAVVHPDDMPSLRRTLTHSFRTGETFLMKYRHRRADGMYRWVDGRADPLRDDEGRIVQWYGVLVDIEDEIRMQEALRSAQDRLARASQAASLAELSASIAHEVNQPLAAVVTNSHACLRWLSAEPPNIQRARITAERIIRDVNSAADVVSRIRALFKQTARERAPVNVNEMILEVCRIMGDEIALKEIDIETDLDDGLPLTIADRVQMQQVLVNLIRNGIDAVDTSTGAPKSLLVRSRANGSDAVLVEVRDHGGGVADPERIFEPFFTTKEHGMGMGLAICRSIVEAHDGRLWAAKNEPRGTAFSFTLPVQAGIPA